MAMESVPPQDQGEMPAPISLTINTLLGGAFLLEVDPFTRVSQVRERLHLG
jgi:hypothetical protein